MQKRYRLLAQTGVTGGVPAWRAVRAADEAPVELRIVQTSDRRERAAVLRRCRLAAMIAHPGVQRVLEIDGSSDPPWIALESIGETTLGESLENLPARGADPILSLLRHVAAGLAAGHRLGLAHGDLGPDSIRLRPDGRPVIDFTACGRCSAWDCAEDIRRLGELWQKLRASNGTVDDEPPLLRQMLAADPADRPPADVLVTRLTGLLSDVQATLNALAGLSDSGTREAGAVPDSSITLVAAKAPPAGLGGDNNPLTGRERLGRYLLGERLGGGGMGAVYRGQDPLDGRSVALKVLRGELAQNETAVRRFHKEARLLAEVNNRFVANLLEVNEDAGVHYLVMEYAQGETLAARLARDGRLPERLGVAVMADVARALAPAHEIGIVHRDLKPENIVLEDDGRNGRPPVKLTDFGLARHVIESDSLNVTHAGALLGTPLYMAPEQCREDRQIDARTDVYGFGATLFHVLSGRPPFRPTSLVAAITMHLNDTPPRLRSLVPELSETVERIVARCLEKAPEHRYAHAGELLEDLERVLRGEADSRPDSLRRPPGDPKQVLRYDFEWQLDASPQALWPHVSNTERLNRALGMSAVNYDRETDGDGAKLFGRIRKLRMNIGWRERPFEWVEPRRLSVVREFQGGPFKWFSSSVDLAARPGGGTTLRHTVEVLPAGVIGRAVAAIEIGLRSRRALERVYRRIDSVASGREPDADPFEPPVELSAAAMRRLERGLDALLDRELPPALVERFGAFLAEAPPQEVSRIRPLALARRLGLDGEQLLTACLYATRDGLLTLLWDILCPVCRIPSEMKHTLQAMETHGRCEACHTEFELDFANSIELVFRAAPELRDCETGVYCLGSPAHSPHVAAQLRLAPRDRAEVELRLEEGAYRLRGPQLPFTVDVRVDAAATAGRLELDLEQGASVGAPRALAPGRQHFLFENPTDRELLVRVERTADRVDAVTAARAAATPLFRELFPDECLAPGRLIGVAHVTLLATRLVDAGELYRSLGDARAFEQIREHFDEIESVVQKEGGSLVKSVGDGVLAVFREPCGALRAALQLAHEHGERLGVCVHRGSAMVATINDLLDYFGSAVNSLMDLRQRVPGGSAWFTDAVTCEEQTAAVLECRGLTAQVVSLDASADGPVVLCPGC
ncbi:MAG: protein kinase [Planctomycetes bacterium]|nr:protein kinase [Planctomycetota bacterium]